MSGSDPIETFICENNSRAEFDIYANDDGTVTFGSEHSDGNYCEVDLSIESEEKLLSILLKRKEERAK